MTYPIEEKVEVSSALSVGTVAVPLLATLLSLLSSFVLICSICRSKVGLSVPYRRIFFGMAFMDCITSIAWTVWMLDLSNIIHMKFSQTFCNISGFLGHFGMVGSAMYTMAISVYFHLVIRKQMRYEEFRKKFEIYLHAIAILYSFAVIVPVLRGSMNYNDGFGSSSCIITFPEPCMPEKLQFHQCNEEERSKVATDMILFVIVPVISAFFVIAVVMFDLALATARDEAAVQSYMSFDIIRPSITLRGSEQDQSSSKNDSSAGNMFTNRCFKNICFFSKRKESRDSSLQSQTYGMPSSRNPRSLRAKIASDRRVKEVNIQAFLYTGGFFLTQIFWLVEYCLFLRDIVASPLVNMLSFCLSSLQGIVNILVYTRNHVKSRRRNNPEMTWFRAFILTIIHGGDHDDVNKWRKQPRKMTRPTRRRSSTNSLRDGGSSSRQLEVPQTRKDRMKKFLDGIAVSSMSPGSLRQLIQTPASTINEEMPLQYRRSSYSGVSHPIQTSPALANEKTPIQFGTSSYSRLSHEGGGDEILPLTSKSDANGTKLNSKEKGTLIKDVEKEEEENVVNTEGSDTISNKIMDESESNLNEVDEVDEDESVDDEDDVWSRKSSQQRVPFEMET